MDESIHVDNEKQTHNRPPLNRLRIAGEILAGATLCVVALLAVCGTGIVLFGNFKTGSVGQLKALGFLALFVSCFPPLYVLGSAVGVYLVGSIGKQKGSLLATLGGGLFGGIVIVILVFTGGDGDKSVGTAEKIVIWGFLSLIGPVMATIGFNLTRRYKKLPSPRPV
jgi:hypothetical protein